MGLYGSLMGRYETFIGQLWVLMCPYGLLWGSYEPLCVSMCPYGSLWVTYGSQWDTHRAAMGPHVPLCVPMGPYVFLRVTMGPYVSLWVFMGHLWVDIRYL